MLILLPPSEGKTGARRGAPARPETWSFPELAAARAEVAAAVVAASSQPGAAKALGVPAGVADQVAWNLELGSAPAAPAGRVYTGVLYDALDLGSLTGPALRRANRWVVVTSALRGAVRLTDRITPYRFHVCADLPGLPGLEGYWREHLDGVLDAAAGRGLVVDSRSSSYASFWRPQGRLAQRWVAVRVPGATHMAKHTRGLVARAICLAGIDPRTPEGLLEPLREAMGGEFAVTLDPPSRDGHPWALSVTPPAGPAAGHRIAAG